jgi:hypothetical protein
MNLKQSLKDLKEAIQKSSKLGSLSTDCQRIFHLGRELKTAGRSLEKLGVGNHGIFLLHLFPRPSKPKKTSSSRSSSSSSSSSRGKRRLRSSKEQPDDDSNTSDKEFVDLANASDEEDEEQNAVEEQVRHSARGRKRRRLTR